MSSNEDEFTHRVRFVQVRYITVNVNASDEDDALEQAYDNLPEVSALETGWGSFGRWTADYDEPVTESQFFTDMAHAGDRILDNLEPDVAPYER